MKLPMGGALPFAMFDARDTAIAEAIAAVLNGLDEALTLLPAGESAWRGRFLRLRMEIGRLAAHHPVATRPESSRTDHRSEASPPTLRSAPKSPTGA
jgi:hypothetical protein